MKFLGIETSCDETSAAIVTDNKEILSNVIFSQFSEHAAFGGVVPEIASRAHLQKIEPVITEALKKANTTLIEIDGIAVTSGPGLIGGVIVGLMTAKAIASVTKKPLICVNHLEGHALTCRLTDNVEFPFLLLLVSGGHCQFIYAEDVGKYKIIGQTQDDAAGEAFDKVAKMLGLGIPGGAKIEQLALNGDKNKFPFPKPFLKNVQPDFSFSGLKTAVLRVVEKQGSEIPHQIAADICASFQSTVSEVIIDRTNYAIKMIKEINPEVKNFVISGGVAANKFICGNLKEFINGKEMNFYSPPLKLCTDNAAMIAWAGIERFKKFGASEITFNPKARWSLEDL